MPSAASSAAPKKGRKRAHSKEPEDAKLETFANGKCAVVPDSIMKEFRGSGIRYWTGERLQAAVHARPLKSVKLAPHVVADAGNPLPVAAVNAVKLGDAECCEIIKFLDARNMILFDDVVQVYPVDSPNTVSYRFAMFAWHKTPLKAGHGSAWVSSDRHWELYLQMLSYGTKTKHVADDDPLIAIYELATDEYERSIKAEKIPRLLARVRLAIQCNNRQTVFNADPPRGKRSVETHPLPRFMWNEGPPNKEPVYRGQALRKLVGLEKYTPTDEEVKAANDPIYMTASQGFWDPEPSDDEDSPIGSPSASSSSAANADTKHTAETAPVEITSAAIRITDVLTAKQIERIAVEHKHICGVSAYQKMPLTGSELMARAGAVLQLKCAIDNKSISKGPSAVHDPLSMPEGIANIGEFHSFNGQQLLLSRYYVLSQIASRHMGVSPAQLSAQDANVLHTMVFRQSAYVNWYSVLAGVAVKRDANRLGTYAEMNRRLSELCNQSYDGIEQVQLAETLSGITFSPLFGDEPSEYMVKRSPFKVSKTDMKSPVKAAKPTPPVAETKADADADDDAEGEVEQPVRKRQRLRRTLSDADEKDKDADKTDDDDGVIHDDKKDDPDVTEKDPDVAMSDHSDGDDDDTGPKRKASSKGKGKGKGKNRKGKSPAPVSDKDEEGLTVAPPKKKAPSKGKGKGKGKGKKAKVIIEPVVEETGDDDDDKKTAAPPQGPPPTAAMTDDDTPISANIITGALPGETSSKAMDKLAGAAAAAAATTQAGDVKVNTLLAQFEAADALVQVSKIPPSPAKPAPVPAPSKQGEPTPPVRTESAETIIDDTPFHEESETAKSPSLPPVVVEARKEESKYGPPPPVESTTVAKQPQDGSSLQAPANPNPNSRPYNNPPSPRKDLYIRSADTRTQQLSPIQQPASSVAVAPAPAAASAHVDVVSNHVIPPKSPVPAPTASTTAGDDVIMHSGGGCDDDNIITDDTKVPSASSSAPVRPTVSAAPLSNAVTDDDPENEVFEEGGGDNTQTDNNNSRIESAPMSTL